MTSLEYVDRARGWADQLVLREMQGPNDYASARFRVEAKYGIPANWLKDLRHRPPKRIPAELYERLRCAYRLMLEQQRQRFEEELRATEALGCNAANSILVRAAAAVAGAKDEEAER